jgi:hypothetical protein
LVVWAAPGSTGPQLDTFLNNLGDTSKVHIARFCPDCDSALMVLTGPSVADLIQSGTAGGGNGSGTSGNPRGGGGGLYYSPNLGVFAPEAKDSPVLQHDTVNNSKFQVYGYAVGTGSKSITKVGLFDTGFDTLAYNSNKGFLATSNGIPSSCLGDSANNGFNFAYKTANWEDDYLLVNNTATAVDPDSRHGTSVGGYIIAQTQQIDSRNASDNAFSNVNILPVKIHDSKGSGTLFNVLCGFAYAKNRGAQIINASFGFYSPRNPTASSLLDSNVLLLQEYVDFYLRKNNILLIAAAGNRDAAHADPKWRNLDSVSFYPASLSRFLDNVIAVTTLELPDAVTHALPPPVSSNQNYSSQVVSIGVVADAIPASDQSIGWFMHPYLSNVKITGSSFATPIVTGTIAAYYSQIPKPINRQNVLSFLQGKKVIFASGSSTTPSSQTVYYMTRN